MSLGQWVSTSEGWAEIVEVSRSRFGSMSYRVVGDSVNGWVAAHQILSEIDDEDTSTEVHFHSDGGSGEHFNTQQTDENESWLDGGTKLPWNPKPTEEFDGHLTQEFEEHNISLTPTNSLKGVDNHPDSEDHNSIYEHRTSSRVAFDADDEDWDDREDYKNREEGVGTDEWNPKRANVGPRKAFVDYLRLIESNSLVREAAWSDVRRKANQIWRAGKVLVKKNDGREIFARVEGDHGSYDVQVHRKNAFGQAITWYDCNCEWGKWAYKRERNFVGRLCSHGLATYFAMQANVQPAKDIKVVDRKTERHSLAGLSPEEADARNHSVDYSVSDAPDARELAQDANRPKRTSYPAYDATQDPWSADYVENRAPRMARVETESLAARSGGLMVWDDNLHKVMKEFFKQPDPAMSADPSGLGDPGAAPAAAGVPGDPMGADATSQAPAMGGSAVTPDQYVRTAEFSKNPEPSNNFEEWPEANSEDAETFNDTDKGFNDKDNDSEFAVYDEFWGRSSGRLDGFQQQLDPSLLSGIAGGGQVNPVNPQSLQPTDPMEKAKKTLPHFIRSLKPRSAALDTSDIENHTPEEIRDTINQFKLNGDKDAAEKFIKERRKLQKQHEGANSSDGDVDYGREVEKQHQTNWQEDPNEGVNGGTYDYNDHEEYQSEDWLTEEEAEWNPHNPSEHGDDDTQKHASYQNALEADEFNADAQNIVANFQRSAAGSALFSDSQEDAGGVFMTVATDPMSRTAGRHFTFAEQQELIDEAGTARHLADLNLNDSFYQW